MMIKPRTPDMMRGLRAIARDVRSYWIPAQQIRSEAWALGGRHLGQVLAGARLESKAPDLPFERATLLSAVIRSEAAKARARKDRSRRGAGGQ
jgi:hypothetical protein